MLGKGKGKSTSSVLPLAFNPDSAAVQFHQTFGQRQSQTGALEFTAEGMFDLFKGVEYSIYIRLTQSDS